MMMSWMAASKRWIIVAVAAIATLVTGCAHRERGSSGATPSVADVTTTPSSNEPLKGTHMTSKGAYTKPSDAELRSRLSPLEYEVTQHEATEPSFRNKFWNNHEAGLYVDVVSGEPLFSSTDKFESGTGWPSFTKPVDPARVTTRTDHKLLMARNEVRSSAAGSHLGHVFDDGPAPQGLRYCINSAALRFVPASELEAQGYGEYRALFGGSSPGSTAGEAAASAASPMPRSKR